MQKRRVMFAALAAAATVSAGLLWSAPSKADVYYGPIKGADGRCWHVTFGVGSPAIGYWGDCERDAPSLFRSERSLHSDTLKGRNPYPR